jgi:hypothetical protein
MSLKKKKRVWNSALYTDLADIISTYFNENGFKALPSIVLEEIFQYLQLPDFANIPAVCKEFKQLSSSDFVWNAFYTHRFLRNNPGSQPQLSSGYLNMFRSRFRDPELGDRVEVSWHGKFRLESSDVYHGLAWWVGVVVDKHSSQGKYKVNLLKALIDFTDGHMYTWHCRFIILVGTRAGMNGFRDHAFAGRLRRM